MIKSLLDHYVKIFQRVETQSLRVRKEEKKKLCCYFYNKGRLYDGKLMVVGRAVNGGNDINCWKQGDSKTRSICKYIEGIYNAQKQASLSWVTEWWGENKVDEKGEKLYNPATSRFWQLVSALTEGLNGESWNKNTWTETIVWSNIYKVSPTNGGNPNFTLKKLQIDLCIEILRIEIDICKPKIILFVTGENWFNDVRSLFETDGSKFVYRYNDGTVAYIYVCERPDRRSPSLIAKRIINEITSSHQIN